MSVAPPRPCPRCGALVVGPCRACRNRAGRARPTSTARGYDSEWSTLARAWLARFPWCGQRLDGTFSTIHSRCAHQNERRRAQVVDHVVPLSAGGARLDPANLQSLCVSCNTAKAYQDARTHRPVASTDGRGRRDDQQSRACAATSTGASSIARTGERPNRMRSRSRVRNF